MREQFIETLRLLWSGRRSAAMALQLMVVLIIPQWLLINIEFGEDSYWVFLSVLLIPVSLLIFLYAPFVLFHALGQRAVGKPVPFLQSCKAVLLRLPALVIIPLVISGIYFGVYGTITDNIPPEYLSVTRLFTGEFGRPGDITLNRVDHFFISFLFFYPVFAMFLLLLPAFILLSGDGLWSAYRRHRDRSDTIMERYVFTVAPFAALALALFHADLLGLFEWFTGSEAPATLVFTVKSITIQLATSIVLVATIPLWKKEEERSAAQQPQASLEQGTASPV